MSVCVSIETTGRYLGISLFRFGEKTPKRLAGFYAETPSRQSELLVPTLSKLLKRARIAKKDLSLVAVDVGPGSFTGVRVGLASARALAQGLNLPLVGISSLEAMAHSMPGLVAPKISALVGECYFAAYENGRMRHAPCWEKEETFERFVSKHKPVKIVTTPPHPDTLAILAIERYAKRPRSAEFQFENVGPMYLQPSWAERSKV